MRARTAALSSTRANHRSSALIDGAHEELANHRIIFAILEGAQMEKWQSVLIALIGVIGSIAVAVISHGPTSDARVEHQEKTIKALESAVARLSQTVQDYEGRLGPLQALLTRIDGIDARAASRGMFQRSDAGSCIQGNVYASDHCVCSAGHTERRVAKLPDGSGLFLCTRDGGN